MKNTRFLNILLIIFMNLWAQSNIKWEEIFDDPGPPVGWQVIDNDGSGTGWQLFSTLNLPGSVVVSPQMGQYFWSSNFQNANLAGVIDEWLISPQISVIYSGDSLYFWAGAVGEDFDDSLRVLVSTSYDRISYFTHQLGSFRVDGTAGSWHRYGFDLSAFDSCNIYIAVNYHIKDGGPGGQYSDHVWLDHFIVTGDPSSINNAPTLFSLLAPPHNRFLHPVLDSTINFRWTASSDGDGDLLKYKLKVLDIFPSMIFGNITDTTLAFNWHGLLNHYSAYRWTMSVSDGKSTIFSPDTFIFFTPPIENVAPFSFALVSPAKNDTLTVFDSIRFYWHMAVDPNSDTVTYHLQLTGNDLDTSFSASTDTSLVIWPENLLEAGKSYEWQVYASDGYYNTSSSNAWTIWTTGTVTIPAAKEQVIGEYQLAQNHPNPFNPVTNIDYYLPATTHIKIEVFNLLGQRIAMLIDKMKPAGQYTIIWDGQDSHQRPVASGIYIYRLSAPQTGTYGLVRKMVLLR
jgi:hypothetical protein